MKNLVFIILFLAILSCQSNQKKDIKSTKKITVIAHRGASGYLPEHTLASKVMAYAMQADYIEQDVVLSKDDVPIVIHDILLDDVTNVDRKSTRLNSSHDQISYAVFCLKKKRKKKKK